MSQPTKPKIVSLDVDGTLVDQKFADTFWHQKMPQLYAQKYNVNFEEALQLLRKYYTEIGDEDIRWYLPRYWFDRFDLEQNPQDILQGMKEEVEVYDDVREVLRKLKGEYKLIVVSNASRIFLEVELEGLKTYFSRIYSCVSDFQQVKKTPEVYQRVCNNEETKPSQLLHVGDDPKFDVEIPKKIGIRAYLIDRSGNNKEALNNLRELLVEL